MPRSPVSSRSFASACLCGGTAATLLAGVVFATGCQMPPMAMMTLGSPKYTLEQTEKLMFLNPGLLGAVTSTGLQQHVREDGRLEVVVNIKNRAPTPAAVEMSVLFRDALTDAPAGETPWRRIELSGLDTQAVPFVAGKPGPRTFTVRIREAAR